jgi:glycosyltransferase involved in cell wall biosynthesis
VIAYGAYEKSSSQPQLIEKWGLQPRDYYLIVGRLIPDNNANLILEGFLKSSTKRKLVIVGDVPYDDAYATAIKLRGETDPRVIFTGYVTEAEVLLELYCNCYVYLHGHEFGGTNPTMLKAMGYQCAILALNTSFNQEMLQNWKYGIYFEKDDQDIATQINSVDNHLETVESLRENSRYGLGVKYNWDHVANQYYRLFKKLLK